MDGLQWNSDWTVCLWRPVLNHCILSLIIDRLSQTIEQCLRHSPCNLPLHLSSQSNASIHPPWPFPERSCSFVILEQMQSQQPMEEAQITGLSGSNLSQAKPICVTNFHSIIWLSGAAPLKGTLGWQVTICSFHQILLNRAMLWVVHQLLEIQRWLNMVPAFRKPTV